MFPEIAREPGQKTGTVGRAVRIVLFEFNQVRADHSIAQEEQAIDRQRGTALPGSA